MSMVYLSTVVFCGLNLVASVGDEGRLIGAFSIAVLPSEVFGIAFTTEFSEHQEERPGLVVRRSARILGGISQELLLGIRYYICLSDSV